MNRTNNRQLTTDDKKLLKGLGILLLFLLPASAAAIQLTGNVTFSGNLAITGSLTKGGGTFVIDHPLDPRNKLLYHSFVESPDVKNIYDGIATLDQNGEAVIGLPNYFMALNKDFRYQFFPHDEAMPDLYIKKEIKDNQFTIAGGVSGGEISWQVTGIRHDPFIEKFPLRVEVWKGGFNTPVVKGECIHEEACE